MLSGKSKDAASKYSACLKAQGKRLRLEEAAREDKKPVLDHLMQHGRDVLFTFTLAFHYGARLQNTAHFYEPLFFLNNSKTFSYAQAASSSCSLGVVWITSYC